MQHTIVASVAPALLASSVMADLTGFTSTVRQVSGGFLVNVYATTNASTDVILNVSGGSVGLPTAGYIRTTSPGGFRQGTDTRSVFAPSGSQNWTTLDSYLTVGGGFNTTTSAWTGNGATQGDPVWNVTYFDTDFGEHQTVNSFITLNNASGFTNPNVNSIPATGGWFIAGSSSPARSLASISSIRQPFFSANGVSYGATSQAAASAASGFLVGQLFVSTLGTPTSPSAAVIEWKMSAILRRADGTTSNAHFSFVIGANDADGDGVPDFSDPCPSTPGPCGGCPLNACGTCGTLPDGDGDGIANCLDNCPSIPNPAQTDCNGNGIGDACETFTDCNQNGIPDSCDVTQGGSGLDCNANGTLDACEIAQNPGIDCNDNAIIDSCEIANGSASDIDGNGIPDECKPDCNGNDLPDAFEIATGLVPDCNSDLIPDTCQGAVLVEQVTPNLGAPSGTAERVHSFGNVPFAATAVSLVLDVRGDLNGQTEFVDLYLNDAGPRRYFVTDGDDCPETPNRATLTLSAPEFNQLVAATGQLVARVQCPTTVDPTECKGNGLTQLQLRYFGIGPKSDCDGNRRLDICDVAGGAADCNSNSVPDACDIARGLLPDCNANGVPDPCEVASTPSVDCDDNGIPDSCDLAAGGARVDCDANGRVDSCQVIEDPAVDCNGNGRPDSCDIASGGASVDCDADGRVDSCQVAENPGVDCNGNGTPDSCDIASSTSADIDGNGRPDECQTVQVPADFPSIQAAISTAPQGEMRIIIVAAGTFVGPIDFMGKPVIVRGAGAELTVIDGTGSSNSSVVRFSGGEPPIAVLEHVTIRGGTTGSPLPNAPQFLAGGGVQSFQSAANLRDCTVEANFASFGGGAYWLNSTGSIERCLFRANAAGADGGGLQVIGGAVQMTDTVIEGNSSNGRGAGVHVVGGRHFFTRTTVRTNQSTSIIGGISWDPAGAPSAVLTLQECMVVSNVAKVVQGGIGVRSDGGPPKLELAATTVCDNVPRPNITGAWINLGGNTVCACVGDLNGDNRVSGDDLGVMLAEWGPCVSPACGADVNGDSTVDGDDLGLLLGNWGPCAP